MKKIFVSVIILLSLAIFVNAQNTSPFWSLSGNDNSTNASKLGTINSVPLRLFTNNAERVHIDSSGKVGIGTPSPLNILTIQLNGSSPASSWLAGGSSLPAFLAFGENQATGFNLATAANASGFRPVLNTRRSRGTLAAPAAVANNDYLASFVSSGYDGSTFQNPATIDFYVDGAPSSGNVPGRISFVTGSNAGNRVERLKVGSTGNFNFNGSQLFLQQSTGNIGIGTGSPAYKLDVQGSTGISSGLNVSEGGILAASTTGNAIYGNATSTFGYGVEGVSNYLGTYGYGGMYGVYGTGPIYGVYGNSSGTSGFGVYGTGNYGVYGIGTTYGVYALGKYGIYAASSTGGYEAVEAYTAAASSYGIYSYSANSLGIYAGTGSTSSYAGYFGGNVYCTGAYLPSDAKLKKNITGVDNAMDIINKLQPKNYEYRNEGNFSKMNLPAGKRYGFIAQDLETILPDLVKETQFDLTRANAVGVPVQEGSQQNTKTETIDFKAVNYTELIPIIVKAMQELNADKDKQIADLQNQVNDLKSLILKGGNSTINASSAGYLKQNVPNPAGNNTVIRYYLADNTGRAQIRITDASGRTLKMYNTVKGEGQLSISGNELPAGTYSYTLYINDKKIDSKQMVIMK